MVPSLQVGFNGHGCAGRSSSSKDDDDKEKAIMPPPVFPYSMSVETRPPTVTRQERLSLAKTGPFLTTLLGYIVQDYDGYGNRIRKQHELVRAEPGENKENAKLYLRITTTPFERTAHNWVTLVSALVCTFGHPGVWWPQQFHRRCHDPRGLHQLRYRLSGCSGTQCHLVASKALRDCL